jgi:hypothetical protein
MALLNKLLLHHDFFHFGGGSEWPDLICWDCPEFSLYPRTLVTDTYTYVRRYMRGISFSLQKGSKF